MWYLILVIPMAYLAGVFMTIASWLLNLSDDGHTIKSIQDFLKGLVGALFLVSWLTLFISGVWLVQWKGTPEVLRHVPDMNWKLGVVVFLAFFYSVVKMFGMMFAVNYINSRKQKTLTPE